MAEPASSLEGRAQVEGAEADAIQQQSRGVEKQTARVQTRLEEATRNSGALETTLRGSTTTRRDA